MSMRWDDLLFMHWPVRAELLRPLIPSGLELDTHDGNAWIGVVPFGMSRVRPRLVPSVPWVSKFLELNVRTYVTAAGRPGVWFFSLDAANPLAVRVARRSFHLPYFDARMSIKGDGETIQYQSTRTHRDAPPATFSCAYRPTGPAIRSTTGSLADFLTNRLCLYSADRSGRIHCGKIDHAPWPLQPAKAEIEWNTMTAGLGVVLPDIAPLLHFSKRLDVVAWRIRPIAG
jgi:uncharacterized protein YqjF (DUF2071 family)